MVFCIGCLWAAQKVQNHTKYKAKKVNSVFFQAGHVWGQSCVVLTELPSPKDWGWKPSLLVGRHIEVRDLCGMNTCHGLFHSKCKDLETTCAEEMTTEDTNIMGM